MQRLEQRGLIRRVISTKGYTYCVATRRTLEFVGDEPRTPRPLTEQTLPVALAVATYCVAKGIDRLTTKEFVQLYPELWRPGMRACNYLLVDVNGKLPVARRSWRSGSPDQLACPSGHRPTEGSAEVSRVDEGRSLPRYGADGHAGAS
jgi:hypothetical protein